jgi:uncharacterized membrane protein YphA (DoxX/SURF4 family)
MFPAGAAGFGLMILRLCAAAMLVRNVVLMAAPVLSWWETGALLVMVGALCIGVFTPAACIVSVLTQIAVLMWAFPRGLFETAVSVGLTLSLLLLGPGAFSVDGRLFGRRRIQLSNSK